MTAVKAERGWLFLLLLACLYFAQGLPFGLLAKALPALAREAGMDRALIGLLALPAAPWALKFLWAPWVDRLGAGRHWHRKRWILVCQLLAAALLVVVASLDETRLLGDHWWLLLLLLTLLNTVCATQDIATDGLAARHLPLALRGLGNSMQVTGYKLGLILGGASILMWVSSLGWQMTLCVAAGLLVLLLLPLLCWREPVAEPETSPNRRQGWHWWLSGLSSLLRRPGMGIWLLVLMGYRTGEDFGAHMIKPWLVDRGWNLAAIGRLELVTGAVSLASAFVCGFLLKLLPRQPLLLCFACLQVLVLMAWVWLAATSAEVGSVWLVSLVQQAVAGMAAVVLMTLMMDRCRPGSEGSDFTLQASVQLAVTGSFVLLSGVSADWLGYAGHFFLAALLALAVILPILKLPTVFDRPDHAQH